jgi:hypothetical protein
VDCSECAEPDRQRDEGRGASPGLRAAALAEIGEIVRAVRADFIEVDGTVRGSLLGLPASLTDATVGRR